MKNILLFALLFTGLAQAQIVNIPDAAFKGKLLAANASATIAYSAGAKVAIDTNGDGDIQVAEAAAIDSLNISRDMLPVLTISDLTGINDFVNLKKLECSNHTLGDLPALNLPLLEILICKISGLTALDILGCPAIKELDCYGNYITALDLANAVQLRKLSCAFNQIASFNLSNVPALEVLDCSENQLTTLDVTAAPMLSGLFCGSNQMTSITGPSASLRTLSCGENLFASLDFSGYTLLSQLQCHQNQLTSLIVTGTDLYGLTCDQNYLTTLDLSGLVHLNNLGCSSNQLTSLSVAGLSGLNIIYAGFNQIATVDFTGAVGLTSVEIPFNQLTTVDLSGLINLLQINLGNNHLSQINGSQDLVSLGGISLNASEMTSFDFSVLPNLGYVSCENSLFTTLDFSQNTYFDRLLCGQNPNLTTVNLKNGFVMTPQADTWENLPNLVFVCADNGEADYIQTLLTSSGLSNVNLNSYCSFTPGGDYNTISGKLIFDVDNNGCDATDIPHPLMKLKINDGTTQGATFSQANADYAFYTQAGTFTVTPQFENPSLFAISPLNAVVNFPVADASVSTNDFCVSPIGVQPDVEIVIAPLLPARPGFFAIYRVAYKNKGNQVVSGNVVFTFDNGILSLMSSNPLPSSQTPGVFTYAFSNLMPFEDRQIDIFLQVNAPTDTPAVNIDDILNFSATANNASDITPDDNVFLLHQTVIGSYDPNDITCIQGTSLPPAEIGKYLHYIVNFENTGTAPAENIIVKVALNENQFDVESLQMINYSNPVTAQVTGNVAEFIFKNINLDTGGHGNVLLKIKSKNSLITGDTVSNKADIYFDYNFPVATNTANTIFETLGINDNPLDVSISISPNPTNGIINVKANNRIQSIQLFDVQGRLLQTHLSNANEEKMNIASQANGVYFVKITSEKGIKIEKIIKR